MKLYTFLIFMFGVKVISGQDFLEVEPGEQPNHLVPIKPDLGEVEIGFNSDFIVTSYCHGLFIDKHSSTAVYEKISKESLIKYGAISLIPDSEKNFFITCVIDKGDGDEIVLERHDKEITADLAKSVQRSWAKMIIKTTYPEKSYIGLGGHNYIFGVFVSGLGFIYGEIWLPQSGLPAKMSELGNGLKMLALSDEKITENEEKNIIAALNAFEKNVTQALWFKK